ncbi:Extracellular triacylglycerol lipase precursor, partial [Rhizoctonia solani]
MVDDIKEGGGRRGWSWSTRGSQLNMIQLLGVTLLLWLSVIAKCSSVTITNPSGVSYVGVRNTTSKQDIFYGIPYAQPPVGPLRFKPPQAWVPASNHTLVNATANRPVCIQSTPIDDSPVSEDCLYLSVWKPNNITMKLPVMVWIYGGGFLNGSTLWYPGEAILNTAFQLGKPVIYVAMNYRLGIYGFPPGKQSEAAGALNLGLKDQRLALEWVKKNIGLFGGDADRVMIFGESAGAMSVAYQMMYKDGKHGGVFRTALMESGAPSTYAALPASYPPRQTAYNFIANATGCAPNNFECLRKANSDTLKEANYNLFKLPPDLRSPDPYPSAIGPTLSPGDPFLTRSPKETIRRGNFTQIPFVCGTNLDEGTIFTTNPETTEDVVAFLTAQLPGLTFGITNKTAVNQLLKYYPAHPSAGSPYNTGNNTFGKASQYKRAASIIGDLVFDAPRRDFLQVATKLGVSAWSYQWAQAGLDLPEFGAAHSFDLAFVFQQRWEGMTRPLIDLSIAMIDYWITLAYKLDPGATANPNRAAWPKYATVGKSLKLEAGNITVIGDDFRVSGMNYIQDNLLT